MSVIFTSEHYRIDIWPITFCFFCKHPHSTMADIDTQTLKQKKLIMK